MLPVFLHSYSAAVSFWKRGLQICCVVFFFQSPFFVACSAFSPSSKEPVLVGCKNSSGGRERALLKPSPEHPWRTKPLSGSLGILLTLCSLSLWVFNALPSFISKNFHLLEAGGVVRGGKEGPGNARELFREGWMLLGKHTPGCVRGVWASLAEFSFIPAQPSRSHQLEMSVPRLSFQRRCSC